ncbi:Cof-type HAD-IIB family hydrolase [Halalkalibacter urbisdiaboli]|uniref:Cof-type HAD-IIB family hydrolase n=1 Tax=Halalkalibacter urbisdiaboli TaxID=1960589 RepID=UPI000B44A4B2|nr:Cof-type HAD-IIB family hydrolase [Halalkalibacter urbisdiaboli]
MKLIATDLDGTLLNESSEISVENATAIKKAQELGVDVVIATGRSYEAAIKPLTAAGLSCPLICLNGAQIYLENRELIRNIPLDKQACERIKQVCEQESVYIEAFTSQGGFSVSREEFIEIIVNIMKTHYPTLSTDDIKEKMKQRFQDEQIEVVENLNMLIDNADIDIYKFLAFSLEDERLEKIRKQLEQDGDINITSSGHLNLEFNHPDANKGSALSLYAKRLGIEMENVMALGDNFNDLSMLQLVGLSVAMENADPAIKELCDYTTKTNTEHGVAFAIEKMLKTLV